MYAWLDYPIARIDIIMAEGKPEGKARQALASLFIDAARRGWDVAHATLYVAKRIENRDVTLRLALTPPPDVVEKWASRGWSIMPMPDDMRVQLLQLLPPTVST